MIVKRTKPSQKGKQFTADYIDYEKAMLKGNELLWNDKTIIIGFYIIFSINTGLRVSDVQSRKHKDLANIKPGEFLRLREKKTKKYKEIQVNAKIVEAYQYLAGELSGTYQPDDFIFRSQKGSVYATESFNTILKEVFVGYARNISTHSLRKSFGRHVYEKNGRTEDCLIKLSELFQHTSMSVTRKYLGIRREELGDIYMNL